MHLTGAHGVEIQTPWLLAQLLLVLALLSLGQLRKLHPLAPLPPVLAILSQGQLRAVLLLFCGLCISASYRTAPVNAQRGLLSGFQERRSRDVLNVQSLCKSSQDWSHWIEPRRAGDCFIWVSWTSCSSMILHDCGREAFAVGSQTVTTRGVIRLAW